MRPSKFSENVRTYLTDGRVFPPRGGSIGSLRIAVTLMGSGDNTYRGVLLLANTDPGNNRVVRLKGAVGGFALGHYCSTNGTPWSTEVGLPAPALRSLVDADTFSVLTERAPEPLASTNGEIVRLQYNDPGVASRHVPAVNGVPLEELVQYQ